MGHMMATGSQRHSGRGQGADPQDPSRRSGVGLTGRGYLDADAGRAFPTLWGTSWDTVSSNSAKHMYIQSLAEELLLTLPEYRQGQTLVPPGVGDAWRPVQMMVSPGRTHCRHS